MLLEFFSDPKVITYMAGGAAFLAVVAFALPFLQQDQKTNRLKAVARRREELSRQQVTDLTPTATLRSARGSKNVDIMKKVLEQLRLQDLIASPKIRESLFQAGYRASSAVVVFLFSRVIMAIVVAGVVAMFVFLMAKFDYPITVKVIFVGVSAVVGFFFPKLFIVNIAQKRQHAMASFFPDAMDLLVICVESGLSIENAFSRVTEEIAEQAPTLAQEIGLTSAELAYLGDRSAAYNNFAKRTGLKAVKSLATTLIQSEKYGTPIAVALRVLSQEQREERMSKAEKKAAALPAQLTVPMIVFFLPLLFLVILGPTIIKLNAM